MISCKKCGEGLDSLRVYRRDEVTCNYQCWDEEEGRYYPAYVGFPEGWEIVGVACPRCGAEIAVEDEDGDCLIIGGDKG